MSETPRSMTANTWPNKITKRISYSKRTAAGRVGSFYRWNISSYLERMPIRVLSFRKINALIVYHHPGSCMKLYTSGNSDRIS
jgi:hypothetical protein